MAAQKVVLGAFQNSIDARNAVAELLNQDVPLENISVAMPEELKGDFGRLDKQTKATEGAAIGGAAGTAIGALAAGLTAVAGIVIPGIGFAVAGPLVAALAGAGVGGTTGGLVGALVGLGITEHEAKFNTSVIQKGGVVVAVTSHDPRLQKRAKSVLERLSLKTETATGTTVISHNK